MVASRTVSAPRRGEIWWARLDPTEGREQAGRRPVVIISSTTFNQGPRELVVVLPITRTRRNAPLHIEIESAESGLPNTSYVMTEQVRSISTGRIPGRTPIGTLSRTTMMQIQDRLIALLDIEVI